MSKQLIKYLKVLKDGKKYSPKSVKKNEIKVSSKAVLKNGKKVSPKTVTKSKKIVPKLVIPKSEPRYEPLPLNHEDALELKKRLKNEPEILLKWAKGAIDSKITLIQLSNVINDIEITLRSNDNIAMELEKMKNKSLSLKSILKLPSGFSFPGYDPRKIEIESQLGRTDYQTSDWWSWFTFCANAYINSGDKFPFRWHDEIPEYEDFVYDMKLHGMNNGNFEIALFSDFGTDYFYSGYIAEQIKNGKFPYAIHLGDVYYAGREEDYRNNFKRWLNPILNDTCLFNLISNHDMYSGGKPYFNYNSQRLSKYSHQRQVGSYFCLRSNEFQLVGIDTSYFSSLIDGLFEGRYTEPKLKIWLEKILKFGRDNNLVNILLSSDHPFDAKSDSTTDLFDDLKEIVVDKNLVDLWFWGNEHNCVLYNRNNKFPFIGSCIGHGGYAEKVLKQSDYEQSEGIPPPKIFAELDSRFYKWPQARLREDMEDNGFCILRLNKNQEIEIEYKDWMGNSKHTSKLKFEKDPNTQASKLIFI